MRRSLLAASLELLLSFVLPAVHAQNQPGVSPQPQPAAAPSRQVPANNSPAAAPQNNAPANDQATTPKSIRRARKVITDDDIQGIGWIYKAGGGPDLSDINNCDRNCFEAVRVAAHIFPGGTQWKRDLLDAIENVRADGPWQALLGDFGAIRGKFCNLEQERNAELARVSDPRNVTAPEISVEEKYNRLFKAAQADLLALYDRAHFLKQAHEGSALEMAFMDHQTSRIITASCYAQQPYRPTWETAGDP
jgi:hypothetical protein